MLKNLEDLRKNVQESLPPGFEAVKWICQEDLSEPFTGNIEKMAQGELIIVSDKHNVVIQGRVGFCIRMAQKLAMRGDHEPQAQG